MIDDDDNGDSDVKAVVENEGATVDESSPDIVGVTLSLATADDVPQLDTVAASAVELSCVVGDCALLIEATGVKVFADADESAEAEANGDGVWLRPAVGEKSVVALAPAVKDAMDGVDAALLETSGDCESELYREFVDAGLEDGAADCETASGDEVVRGDTDCVLEADSVGESVDRKEALAAAVSIAVADAKELLDCGLFDAVGTGDAESFSDAVNAADGVAALDAVCASVEDADASGLVDAAAEKLELHELDAAVFEGTLERDGCVEGEVVALDEGLSIDAVRAAEALAVPVVELDGEAVELEDTVTDTDADNFVEPVAATVDDSVESSDEVVPIEALILGDALEATDGE